MRRDGDAAGAAAPAPRCVAGADVSYAGGRAVAGVAFLEFPSLELLHSELGELPPAALDVPYMPGFLALREAPAILVLLRRAALKGYVPDLLFVDGNGRLHPERGGLACHVGLLSGLPTIGAAKSLFAFGGLKERQVREDCARALAARAGRGPNMPPVALPLAPLPGGEALGSALCGHAGSVRPIFISVGHRVSLARAVELTELCCRHRVPEPVRQADFLTRKRLGERMPALGGAPPLRPEELAEMYDKLHDLVKK